MTGAHRKTRNRILAVGLATLTSLFGAEILFRWLGPTDYAPGTILTADGRQVPLSELAHYLRHSEEGNRGQAGPRGRIQANLHFKHSYDRPSWDYFDDQGCISIDTNSLGFRDLEFPVERGQFIGRHWNRNGSQYGGLRPSLARGHVSQSSVAYLGSVYRLAA